MSLSSLINRQAEKVLLLLFLLEEEGGDLVAVAGCFWFLVVDDTLVDATFMMKALLLVIGIVLVSLWFCCKVLGTDLMEALVGDLVKPCRSKRIRPGCTILSNTYSKEAFKKTVKTTPPAKNGKKTSLENLWYRLRC
jgi:hypothetical protein